MGLVRPLGDVEEALFQETSLRAERRVGAWAPGGSNAYCIAGIAGLCLKP